LAALGRDEAAPFRGTTRAERRLCFTFHASGRVFFIPSDCNAASLPEVVVRAESLLLAVKVPGTETRHCKDPAGSCCASEDGRDPSRSPLLLTSLAVALPEHPPSLAAHLLDLSAAHVNPDPVASLHPVSPRPAHTISPRASGRPPHRPAACRRAGGPVNRHTLGSS